MLIIISNTNESVKNFRKNRETFYLIICYIF